MAQWQFQYVVLGVDKDISISYRNVTGTPCDSAILVADRGEGCAQPLAGVYRFTMDSVWTNRAYISIVNGDDTGNPLIYSGYKVTVNDGATENLNLIPGVSVVMNAGTAVEDVFEIGIGCYWSTDIGAWIRPIPLGPGLPGWEATQRTIKVQNVSGYTISNCKIVATNACRVENSESNSRPFYSFRQIGILNPTADGDLLGRAVTFANVAGGTCDILVDGSPISVYDVTNDTLHATGTSIAYDDTTVLKFSDGTSLQSVEFILSSSLSGTDTATIYTSDGGESVELADSGGSFVSGATGINATESGQATGTMTTGSEMAFYLRLAPDASEDTDLNPRAYSLRISGTKV